MQGNFEISVTKMVLPQKVRNFIEVKAAMTNMALPWNYPSIDKFNDFQAPSLKSIAQHGYYQKSGKS